MCQIIAIVLFIYSVKKKKVMQAHFELLLANDSCYISLCVFGCVPPAPPPQSKHNKVQNRPEDITMLNKRGLA